MAFQSLIFETQPPKTALGIVAFVLDGFIPRQVAEELGMRDIFVWDGNYYALSVTESFGVEKSGGMVHVGPVHYNTLEEIWSFGEVLREIARS